MSGAVTPPDAFQLRDKGVLLFLPKPFDMAILKDKVAEASRRMPSIDMLARESVGKTTLVDAKDNFTREMITEALAKAKSVRGAAKLLGVSRQRLYYLMDALNIKRSHESSS